LVAARRRTRANTNGPMSSGRRIRARGHFCPVIIVVGVVVVAVELSTVVAVVALGTAVVVVVVEA
jgi:hypothetical protein